jgi:deoxyadenosine/deoxycytidine kinase
MYFVFIYENRRMKTVEIVLRRGRTMEGINPNKIYFKHICKYYNVFPYKIIIC